MGVSAVPIRKLHAQAQRDWTAAPLNELIVHIVSRHHTFLRSHLPRVEYIFDQILEKKHDEVGHFILPLGRAFLDLRLELEIQLEKEEDALFPLIIRLGAQRDAPARKVPPASVIELIRLAEREHDSSKRALQEMRRITNNYCDDGCMCHKRSELFEALKELDGDLNEHMALESNVLYPRTLRLAEELREGLPSFGFGLVPSPTAP